MNVLEAFANDLRHLEKVNGSYPYDVDVYFDPEGQHVTLVVLDPFEAQMVRKTAQNFKGRHVGLVTVATAPPEGDFWIKIRQPKHRSEPVDAHASTVRIAAEMIARIDKVVPEAMRSGMVGGFRADHGPVMLPGGIAAKGPKNDVLRKSRRRR